MRVALLAPILPRVMQAALILMKNSHFDRTLRYDERDDVGSYKFGQLQVQLYLDVMCT